MKDFYTIVDDDGFPVKMYLEDKLLHIKKVSINKCEEYQSLFTAKNGLNYLHKEFNNSNLMIMSGKHPFKIARVVTVRHLIEVEED